MILFAVMTLAIQCSIAELAVTLVNNAQRLSEHSNTDLLGIQYQELEDVLS